MSEVVLDECLYYLREADNYLSLYQEIDPSICLWAIDETRYLNNSYCLGNEYLCDCNKWLRNNSIRVRSHYHASTTTTLYFKDM